MSSAKVIHSAKWTSKPKKFASAALKYHVICEDSATDSTAVHQSQGLGLQKKDDQSRHSILCYSYCSSREQQTLRSRCDLRCLHTAFPPEDRHGYCCLRGGPGENLQGCLLPQHPCCTGRHPIARVMCILRRQNPMSFFDILHVTGLTRMSKKLSKLV